MKRFCENSDATLRRKTPMQHANLDLKVVAPHKPAQSCQQRAVSIVKIVCSISIWRKQFSDLSSANFVFCGMYLLTVKQGSTGDCRRRRTLYRPPPFRAWSERGSWGRRWRRPPCCRWSTTSPPPAGASGSMATSHEPANSIIIRKWHVWKLFYRKGIKSDSAVPRLPSTAMSQSHGHVAFARQGTAERTMYCLFDILDRIKKNLVNLSKRIKNWCRPPILLGRSY